MTIWKTKTRNRDKYKRKLLFLPIDEGTECAVEENILQFPVSVAEMNVGQSVILWSFSEKVNVRCTEKELTSLDGGFLSGQTQLTWTNILFGSDYSIEVSKWAGRKSVERPGLHLQIQYIKQA